MDAVNRASAIAGAFFLATFVTAITGRLLYGTAVSDPAFVLGDGAGANLPLGALLEAVLCVANIGTAVVLLPLLKRTSEAVAQGYVASRVVESAIIVIGILSLLALERVRSAVSAGELTADAASPVGVALQSLNEWTFLFGPGFLAGFGNGLLLGYLMYRSRLVPRGMALVGLIGGPICTASGVLVLFGFYGQSSVWSGLATLPEIVWEAFLGIFLLVQGLRGRLGLAADRGAAARIGA